MVSITSQYLLQHHFMMLITTADTPLPLSLSHAVCSFPHMNSSYPVLPFPLLSSFVPIHFTLVYSYRGFWRSISTLAHGFA
ncbi:hypothetical protein BDV95DRAFT_311209 [Massariosphaeria phaeospora]|uniref:Uncharacterized protein n=1 Tax=Massariosphaeria phaeospora TaxID=100035 RepID=A0A7C8IB41_9PLEO|nr:hypothetical protein BDV95DRAFT_311209 [Massariosphaeria phaeospora]